MNETHADCQYEQLYTVQFKGLKEDLQELKARVNRLEASLGQGILLLVANLAGVIVMLMERLI